MVLMRLCQNRHVCGRRLKIDILEIENTVDLRYVRGHTKSAIIHISIDDLTNVGTLFGPMEMLTTSDPRQDRA
jgi:hypothetical protein